MLSHACVDARLTLQLIPYRECAYWWQRLLDGLPVPELQYGPECRVPRPRPGESFFSVHVDTSTRRLMGRRDGDDMIGLIYVRTFGDMHERHFGLGVLHEYDRRGFGPKMRDVALTRCFDLMPGLPHDVVRTDVYKSNLVSINMHVRHGVMRFDRTESNAIRVHGRPIHRIWYALTREEWLAKRTPSLQSLGED